jgi:hypothetical protein
MPKGHQYRKNQQVEGNVIFDNVVISELNILTSYELLRHCRVGNPTVVLDMDYGKIR